MDERDDRPEKGKPETKVTGDDIETVSRKLEDLARDLPEQERNVLGLILTRAAAAGDIDYEQVDPEEMTVAREFDRPFAGQLARAAGLFSKPEVTVVVGWSYRFGFEGLPEVEERRPEF